MSRSPAFSIVAALLSPLMAGNAHANQTTWSSDGAIQKALSAPDAKFADPECVKRVASTGDHQTLVGEGYRVSEISLTRTWDALDRPYYRVTLTYLPPVEPAAAEARESPESPDTDVENKPAAADGAANATGAKSARATPIYSAMRCQANTGASAGTAALE